MPEVLVATPLNYSAASRAYQFADGISIREISTILWDISVVKGYVSATDKTKMDEAKYWICASQEYEYVLPQTGDELYTKARNAALALQVLAPSGAMHVFLKFQRTDSGYDNIGALHLKELCRTRLGKLMSAEKLGLEKDFKAVYTGISRAFAEKVVRFQNPVILLEQGMQTGHVGLGTLMFVMGLDMIFMAGGIDNFMKPLGGFLGPDSYVFPPVSSLDLQPSTTVRDVLNELYEFRNIIAHGLEIPEIQYRRKSDLISTGGQRITYEDYYRTELLLDSALFILTTSLRRIFTENLFDEVKDLARWKVKMSLYEHRHKEAGGPEVNKRHGR
jgi:hypothetical protein